METGNFQASENLETDESDMDKIYNKITLASAFTGKQANHHILPPPPPPPQLHVVS